MKKLILITGFFLVFGGICFSQTAAEWNKQGVEHSKKYEYKVAYECFSRAIALKADFAEAYYNRAIVWFELPGNAFPETDGCADLKKAKSLGFKVTDKELVKYGCK